MRVTTRNYDYYYLCAELRRKRILYRCKQRGLLELDLLMGSWAERNLPLLEEKDLDDLDKLSLAETPSLLKWLLAREDVPPEYNSPVFRRLRDYAIGSEGKNRGLDSFVR